MARRFGPAQAWHGPSRVGPVPAWPDHRAVPGLLHRHVGPARPSQAGTARWAAGQARHINNRE
uniref:Uncharacterized protein n=1 Tax=Oryza sativa subsp. japonica TaxID=39947 RepID=Q6EPS1_ORYSJ|nr:hypothetical protein [Oryza sativa Japonica Group]